MQGGCPPEVGPNFYTVVEDFIKPATHESKASWALSRHPGGLDCDLFVTHAWVEGVYEFIDKVLDSWPWGARRAVLMWSIHCCATPHRCKLGVNNSRRSERTSLVARRSSPFVFGQSSSWEMDRYYVCLRSALKSGLPLPAP